ncbi:MAG: SDR family oxidoreductase [Spirochaetales bacterium]|nr:SDR family oxidoreductase [Spirochaetales bacterium]
MAIGYKQVTLITGASSGIGFALVFELLKRNHLVLASMRKPDRAQASFEAHPSYPLFKDNLRLCKLDVTTDSCEKTIARLVKEYGVPDIVINNAGLGVYGPFEELTDQEFRSQFETNFFGALRVARAVLPGMRKEGHGKLINVSSILGQLAIPTGSAYTASKWAMEAWSEALRYEVAPFGVSVTLIEPGLIRTQFKKNMVIARAIEPAYAFLHKLVGRNYDRVATSPEACARRIAKVILRSKPATRYRVGYDAHFYYLLRQILPDRFLDLLIRSYTGKPGG